MLKKMYVIIDVQYICMISRYLTGLYIKQYLILDYKLLLTADIQISRNILFMR